MSNIYYVHGSTPINRSLNASALIRTEFDAISAGFDLVASPTGNPYRLAVINAAGTAQTVSSWTIYGGGNLTVNSAYGFGALAANTAGTGNTATGYMALNAITIGINGSAYGNNALVLATGNNNTGFGALAGATVTTGTNSTFFGAGADSTSATGINRTAVGFGASATADNQVKLGDANVTEVSTAGAYKNTITTGPPLIVASTILVTNLYAARSAVADLVVISAWVSGTTYAIGNVVYSPIDFNDYRRKTSGAGTTDPSLDSTNWGPVTRSLGIAWVIKTGNYNVVSGDALQCDTTAGGFILTLPATPAANNYTRVADYAGTFATNNLTIVRNGNKIQRLAQDMTVSTNNVNFVLTFIDTTVGWLIL